MITAVRSLVAVVQLTGQVRRVIGVQYSRTTLIFDGPHNPILRSVRAYARSGARIGKTSGRLTRRSRRQQCIRDRKRLKVIPGAGVENGVLEKGSHGPRAATQCIRQLLVNRIITAGIE